MNSPLADIGAELRQARESQKRSLDDLSHETLIHGRHLLALEDGREADLPEPFYVKNFIRKYANALGLGGDAMANRYWDTRPLPEHPPKPQTTPDFVVPWWVFPAMLGALLLGAIGTFAVMNANRGPSPVAEATGSASEPSTDSVATSTASALATDSLAATDSYRAATATDDGAVTGPDRSGTGTATADTTSAGTETATETATAAVATAPTPTPGPVNLPPLVVPGHQIKFQTLNKEAAWMQIVADGREIHSGVMPRNMVRTWTASRSLAVRIGKPGVVTARLGDRPLGTLGPKDAPVFRRTFLTREGELAMQRVRTGEQPRPRPTPRPLPTSTPAPAESEASPPGTPAAEGTTPEVAETPGDAVSP